MKVWVINSALKLEGLMMIYRYNGFVYEIVCELDVILLLMDIVASKDPVLISSEIEKLITKYKSVYSDCDFSSEKVVESGSTYICQRFEATLDEAVKKVTVMKRPSGDNAARWRRYYIEGNCLHSIYDDLSSDNYEEALKIALNTANEALDDKNCGLKAIAEEAAKRRDLKIALKVQLEAAIKKEEAND